MSNLTKAGQPGINEVTLKRPSSGSAFLHELAPLSRAACCQLGSSFGAIDPGLWLPSVHLDLIFRLPDSARGKAGLKEYAFGPDEENLKYEDECVLIGLCLKCSLRQASPLFPSQMLLTDIQEYLYYFNIPARLAMEPTTCKAL